MTDAPMGIPPEAYQALYYDVATWAVRDGLLGHVIDPAGINEITKLFLSLGGFFVDDAGNTNNGNPSRKMARYRLIEARVAATGGNLRTKMLESYPGNYPLTANLVRMTVPRKLIEAGLYMGGSAVVPNRRMDNYFRTRLCDHHGQVVWPLTENVDATIPCWGGQLCDVTWWPDEKVQSGYPFVRVGASNHPLLTLFPAGSPAQPPRSFFWASPGIRLMVPSDPSFAAFCENVANSQLVESYFPVSSYQLPQYFVATRIYVK